jgi:hypothetical protein
VTALPLHPSLPGLLRLFSLDETNIMSMMTTQHASLTDFLELLLFSTTLLEERKEISSNLQPDE